MSLNRLYYPGMDIKEAKELIEQFGLKKTDVAKHMGIDQSYLSRYFNGTVKPPPKQLQRLFDTIFLLYRAELAAGAVRDEVIANG